MPISITMPQQTDTMTEGTVVKWLKKEGEKVKAGEPIAEIETDKAVMEMEAFEGGTLAHVAAQVGEKVAVGAVIALLASASEKVDEVKKSAGGMKAPTAAAQAGAKAPSAPSAPSGDSATATLEDASRGELHEPDDVGHGATRETPTAVPPVSSGNGHGNGHGASRLFVSPLARRIAVEKGLDLGQIKGSGPGGRIVQADVLAFAEQAASAAAPAAAPTKAASAPAAPATPARVGSGEKQVIPMTKMRTAIAAALQRSKQQIPHFYETIDIDVEEVSALRARINEQLKAENIKLSLADFINKAICLTLLKHPAVNATFDEKKNEITRYGDVHLGTAVSVPDGLIVPVLKNAGQMGLRELRQRSAELIDRARSQRLKQDEGSGGTFTVSSLGTFGIREFSAIINPPQVAILAVGTAEKRAVVDKKGAIVARTMMTVTLSADHRVVDGALAAEFLRTFKTLLEEPGMMLV